ncbi:ferritin family protein, partial [Candidatus Altiarchaeota archaeon]
FHVTLFIPHCNKQAKMDVIDGCSPLQILDGAIKLEREGRRFYREAAGKVDDAAVREVLKRLENDEQDHQELLEYQYDSLSTKREWLVLQDFVHKCEEPERIREKLFDKEEGSISASFKEEMSVREVLDLGIKLERGTMEYYRKAAQEISDDVGRQILEHLANWEEGHLKTLEEERGKII